MNTFNRLRSTIPSLVTTSIKSSTTTTTTIASITSPIGRHLFNTSSLSTPNQTQSQSQIKLSLGSNTLNIQFHPKEPSYQFPYTWLQDSDPGLIHSTTKQRLHLSSQVPIDRRPLEVELVN